MLATSVMKVKNAQLVYVPRFKHTRTSLFRLKIVVCFSINVHTFLNTLRAARAYIKTKEKNGVSRTSNAVFDKCDSACVVGVVLRFRTSFYYELAPI